MSTFADLIARPGTCVAYFFDVSVDRFSTVSYRYGTVAGLLDGTNEYVARVKSLGDLARGFGTSGIAPSTVDVELDNTDAGADWLVDRGLVVAWLFRSQWRLRCRAWSATDATDYAVKTLGIFTPGELPVRDWSVVRLTLVDRTMGDGSDFALTPTIRDIASDLYADGIISNANPELAANVFRFDIDAPLPLVFAGGQHQVPLILVCDPLEVETSSQLGYGPCGFIVCCTSLTSAAPAIEGYELFGVRVEAPGFGVNSGRFLVPLGGQAGLESLLTVKHSSTVTKDGKDWRVTWLEWDSLAWQNLPWNAHVVSAQAGTGVDLFEMLHENVCRGYPYSARTYTTPTARADGRVKGPEVAYDLLRYYSRGLVAGDIDAASFTAAAAAMPGDSVFGRCGAPEVASMAVARDSTGGGNPPVFERLGGALRDTLSQLCSASGFDVFTDWSGSFSAAVHLLDFDSQTVTLAALDELLIAPISDAIPSPGERWAPFNRLYLQTRDGTLGPFEVGAVSAWERLQPRTIDARWADVDSATARLWADAHGADNAIRPRLRLRYPLAGLNLELGDYVTCGWTRAGRGTPYATTTTWRVEGLTLSPDAKVEVELVWMGDLRTSPPYLLDDETLLTRASGSAGRTCTLTTGSSTVHFSSGSLITDAAAAGDTLIVRDATEADGTWARNRALLIASITDADDLVIDTAEVGCDTAFGAGGPFTLATWEIRRGAGTYHTSASDPANYPSGGLMYGKACNATLNSYTDNYAGQADANLLLNG